MTGSSILTILGSDLTTLMNILISSSKSDLANLPSLDRCSFNNFQSGKSFVNYYLLFLGNSFFLARGLCGGGNTDLITLSSKGSGSGSIF